jgi:hypothetical protein
MKSSADVAHPGHWLLPSLTHVLWLALLLVMLAQPWRRLMIASDGDACMHWRCGEWMLEHRAILRADPFSFTRPGAPSVPKEWLSQIVMAFAARAGNLYGIAALAALAIATAFALLHRQLVRAGNDATIAAIVVVLAGWAASAHWLARPHAFSFLMAVLWNDAVRRVAQGERSLRPVIALAILSALWVNLHGGYLAGFLLLGAYWLGALLKRDRRTLKRLTVAGVICALATLVNPTGYRVHAHNFAFLKSTFFKGWLAEYASIRFDSPDAIGFAVWLAVIFLTLAICRPRVRAGEAVALLSWTYFALYAARNIPLLAIFSAPSLAPAWSAWARRRWPVRLQRLHDLHWASRGWPVALTAAAVAILAVPRPTAMPADDWPVDAVRFIRDDPARFAGKMFNEYRWGGYLLQALPQHQVFVDGRADMYGEEFVKEFDATAGLRTNWPAALEKYDVSWTLMPRAHRLNQALALLPEWQCVYSNETACIYWRKR